MAQFSQALDQLEQSISTMKVAYSRFLSGDLETPPVELGSKIRSAIRVLHEETRSTADRYRLRGLEARLSSYSELFSKRVLAAEEGRARPRARPRSWSRS